MKALLLASALAFGGTAFAQDTTTPPAPPAADMQTPPAAPTPPEAPTAPDTQTPPAAPMAPATPMSPAAPMAPDAADPAGGYAPAGPALQGTLAPGQTPVFQPSMSPAQAYPPPAPLQSYPICKKGQYDNCRQRGG